MWSATATNDLHETATMIHNASKPITTAADFCFLVETNASSEGKQTDKQSQKKKEKKRKLNTATADFFAFPSLNDSTPSISDRQLGEQLHFLVQTTVGGPRARIVQADRRRPVSLSAQQQTVRKKHLAGCL